MLRRLTQSDWSFSNTAERAIAFSLIAAIVFAFLA